MVNFRCRRCIWLSCEGKNSGNTLLYFSFFNCFFKLRSYLTEVLLDQMPVLSELQRYLEQLSIMDPPAVKSELIIEQVGLKY